MTLKIIKLRKLDKLVTWDDESYENIKVNFCQMCEKIRLQDDLLTRESNLVNYQDN